MSFNLNREPSARNQYTRDLGFPMVYKNEPLKTKLLEFRVQLLIFNILIHFNLSDRVPFQ